MKQNNINKSMETLFIIRGVASALTLFFAIGIVGLAGEPAPGEEALTETQFIVGELVCFGAAAITGTIWTRANQRIQYLMDKKNRD